MYYFIEHVTNLHKCLPYFAYVCWEIAVGLNKEPIFVEMNLRGDVTLFQLISGPLFEALTDEILETVRDYRSKK